jgi:uncharacterized SAM-binding protein YcdF (DUF218 family)
LPKRRFRRGWWAESWRWAFVLVITGGLALAFFLGSLIAAIYWQARTDGSRPVDAIVVLGTAQYNGKPSPDLKARLDEALAAYKEGYAPYIVVTGGKLEGDAYTEAETGQIYLTDHGVPESAILMETEGNDSWQSMQGAADMLKQRGLKRVLLVSDGFHIFRLKLMARELGLTAFGRPASDSPIKRNSRNELDYVIREAGGAIVFEVQHLL